MGPALNSLFSGWGNRGREDGVSEALQDWPAEPWSPDVALLCQPLEFPEQTRLQRVKKELSSPGFEMLVPDI